MSTLTCGKKQYYCTFIALIRGFISFNKCIRKSKHVLQFQNDAVQENIRAETHVHSNLKILKRVFQNKL